ncbi:MAG: aminoacetone oxidase family FAD-binding enzyme, partial [Oscillospiraceae bacterium]
PSLVPLVCGGEDCANLQGLSLKNIALTLEAGGRTLFREQGELIFTHFGISGPLVLSASARLVGQAVVGARATIDLKPALDEKTLDRRLLRDFAEQLNREFKNALGELLPSKLIPIVVMQSGIDPTKKINSITAKERAALIGVLKGFELNITDTRPIEEAVITAGGVSTKEIDPKTMMSKKIKNLHFAGEVLDADGYTGGFNLGIAFATGHAAGSHILEEESR